MGKLDQVTDIIQLQITDVSKDGNGVAYFNGKNNSQLCVEVPFTMPGDLVLAKIQRKHRGVFKATLESIITPSPMRIEPKCQHFASCGGCRLQHFSYEDQLKWKEGVVRKIFAKLLTSDKIFHPIIGSHSTWRYRNKMEFSFFKDETGKRSLGLKTLDNRGKVFDIAECHLSSSWFVDVAHAVKQWWEDLDPQIENAIWPIRTLMLREGQRTGDRMVVLTISNMPELGAHKNPLEKFIACVKKIAIPTSPLSQLSIFLRIQQSNKGESTNFYEMCLHGKQYFREQLHLQTDPNDPVTVLNFNISPSTFFHHNVFQAEHLYTVAYRLLKLNPNSIVYHLYCGIGTLGYYFAKHVKQVIGIEMSPEIVCEADSNAKLNGFSNISFYTGAVRHVLNVYGAQNYPKPEVVILSPPRPELDPKSIENILRLEAKTILHISSNPYTQVVDIEKFIQNGYEIEAVQPADHFPHTAHIENIVLLVKK